jgi:hypothetical protein
VRARAFLCACLLTVLLLLGAASVAVAGYHAYTPQRPRNDEALRHGQLSTQVNFQSQRGPIFQWGYQLNPATYRAGTGPMVENGDIYCNGRRVAGYHDHHVVPPTYLIHSSFKPLRTTCRYQLAVNEAFPIRGGTRLVYLRYNFYISLA